MLVAGVEGLPPLLVAYGLKVVEEAPSRFRAEAFCILTVNVGGVGAKRGAKKRSSSMYSFTGEVGSVIFGRKCVGDRLSGLLSNVVDLRSADEFLDESGREETRKNIEDFDFSEVFLLERNSVDALRLVVLEKPERLPSTLFFWGVAWLLPRPNDTDDKLTEGNSRCSAIESS